MTKRLFALLLLVTLCPLRVDAAEKANVLFLAVDDMNDWVGCLETTPRAITPNLDRLAARGVNFTNAHTAGVFCAPSRAAIFTGQFASTTGCYQTANYFVDHPEIEPLQVSFSKAGYQTFGAGKLFHHPAGAIDVRGWNEFFLRNQSQREGGWPLDSWSKGTPFPDPFPNSIYNKGEQITGGLFLEWGAIPNDREEEMADTVRINWAVEKLKEKHHEPFFLGVGIYAPHFPNYCPQKYFDLYDPDEITLPPYKATDLDDLPPKIKKMKTARSRIHQKLEGLEAVDDAIHGYLACMSYADAMMGRVLDALEASPYAENTIVVLWSDHGYHHGEKGDWGKHTLWERTSNVPFIWAGPGIAGGQKTDVSVSLIDMYPTFVDVCGLPKPHQKLAADEEWKELFDGQTLAGWRNPYDRGEAKVIDGEIRLTADQKFFLCTEKTYSDFIFEAEIKMPEGKSNSGFMFRAHVKPNKVWGYQAEVDTSDRAWSGGLFDEARRKWLHPQKPNDSSSAKKFREKTTGSFKRNDWNRFRIQAEGSRLRIWVNDVLCTDFEDDMDAKGYIGLQHHGEDGQIYRFRNIRIKEL